MLTHFVACVGGFIVAKVIVSRKKKNCELKETIASLSDALKKSDDTQKKIFPESESYSTNEHFE